MPNFHTPSLNLQAMPISHDGYSFEFAASSSDSKEILIYTSYKDKSFFLVVQKKDDYFLVKNDKLSKISPIFIIQNALKAFRDLHNVQTTYSNIESKKSIEHFQKSDRYIKDIKFFANDFEFSKEIWVEVGFGSGRHLLYQAKKNPNIQFIGLEIHSPSIEQVIKQCKLQNIENILICKFDARVFLELLPSNSVGRIFVHFPVPWDKKPHRRVFSRAFIDESIRVLKQKGTLELRTDSQNYYEYSFNLFNSLNQAEFIIRKNLDLDISSKYEDRWKKMQKNIYDLTLINNHLSPQKETKQKLEFKKSVDLEKIKSNFKNEVIRGDGFFVHFEKIFDCGKNCLVMRLSYGANEACEHQYLIFNDNKIQYFPSEPLPTMQNLKAHKKIEEFLYG